MFKKNKQSGDTDGIMERIGAENVHVFHRGPFFMFARGKTLW